MKKLHDLIVEGHDKCWFDSNQYSNLKARYGDIAYEVAPLVYTDSDRGKFPSYIK